MRCICGHTTTFHDGDTHYETENLGACEECECLRFRRDPNWEPPDPPGWEGGFAKNH